MASQEEIVEHLEFKMKEKENGYFAITVKNTHPTNIEKGYKYLESSIYSKAVLRKLKAFLEEFLKK